MEKTYGYSGSGTVRLFAHDGRIRRRTGAICARPFANVGPLKIESDLPDEKVLFLSDIFPTGYMAAENAQIEEGDTVARMGLRTCRPVRHRQRLHAGRRRVSSPSIAFRSGCELARIDRRNHRGLLARKTSAC